MQEACNWGTQLSTSLWIDFNVSLNTQLLPLVEVTSTADTNYSLKLKRYVWQNFFSYKIVNSVTQCLNLLNVQCQVGAWHNGADLVSINDVNLCQVPVSTGMGDWRHISSYGQFRRYLKNHLFGNEKSQRSVTHDSLRYINILTYLLTYLLCVGPISVCNQPPSSTQPGHLFMCRSNECQPKGDDALWLGSYGSCAGGR